jgi:hypothetical protein
VFPELNRDRHVVAAFSLPESWRRFNGIDWGYAAPFATIWGAQDEDGRVWIYREIYERQVGEADQARRILAAEAPDEHIAVRYADDAMWATRGDARPISDEYAAAGVYLTPAGKGAGSRIAGWQRIHSYLADAPACPVHRARGWAMCPKLHMFPAAENLLRELADLPHATSGDPEDADSKADDHAADALRYLLINLGGGPEYTIFPDDPVQPLTAQIGITPGIPLGQSMTFRPPEHEPQPWDDDDDDEPKPWMARTFS